MAKSKSSTILQTSETNPFTRGHFHRIDTIPHGDEQLVGAISSYGSYIDTNRSSQRWAWSINNVENILFGAGRQYVNEILTQRLTANSTGTEVSLIRDTIDNIPKPVNDLLGRYIETNISLLTENRPMPRVSAKTEDIRDQKAAELSELTLEFMWETLKMPELHREIARLILYCGTAWVELGWDPAVPRYMKVPQTEKVPFSLVPSPIEGASPVRAPVPREVTRRDKFGQPVYTTEVEYGDLSTSIISSFELHVPTVHEWDGPDMGWVMREFYVNIDEFKSKYRMAAKGTKGVFNKSNGWFLENLDKISSENVTKLPLWWWERLITLVEGSGPGLYGGTPDQYEGHTVVRILDRKPNEEWPNGRTVIVAGSQLIYDSTKKRGARAYDSRWPHRWHPYVRFRWEPLPGQIYGRSLVSKLLPKLKRINAIDTTMIMWRRTVPMAGWIVPKGTHPQKDSWTGRPGLVLEFDPKLTAGERPEPIQPTSYPEAILREREQQLQEMEFIAGTEQILRGERPQGVSSAAALDMLRKQTLASRSPMLQSWDESLQAEGSAILQEVIKNIKEDRSYLERIRILAREKASALTIERFSGDDISDNVMVKIDTASQALLSKEAKEAKTIEFLQYSPNLIALPLGLQQSILDNLGFDKALNPAGKDVERVRRMIGWIKSGDFKRVQPFAEDDPFVFYEMLVNETKSDGWWDLAPDQQQLIYSLMDIYKRMIQFRMLEQQQLTAFQTQSEAGVAPGQPIPAEAGKQ